MKTSSERAQLSSAATEGYNYLGPRCHNPYQVDYGAPRGTAKPGMQQEHDDWDHGWLIRFYGETI
jgi:hypothetical protein